MNIHRIIEDALEGNDGIVVPTPVEQSFCEDEQVMKLASALQFIGNNLEYSIPTPEEILAQADLLEKVAATAEQMVFVDSLGLPRQVVEQLDENTIEAMANAKGDPKLSKIVERIKKNVGNPNATSQQISTSVTRGTEALQRQFKLDTSPIRTFTSGAENVRKSTPASTPASTPRQGVMPSLVGNRIDQTPLVGAEGNPLTKAQADEAKQRFLDREAESQKLKSEQASARKAAREAAESGDRALAKIEPTTSGSTGGSTASKADDLTFGQKLKNFGRSAGEMTGVLGTKGQTALNRAGRLGATAGVLGLGAYGASQLMGGDDKEEKKTAALYQAAQYGKASLLEKIAEDAINPARINAGPADPYSGEIMPDAGKVSSEFVGNTRDHHALIALKAQKVRDRINKDMRQYVNNVGDGYNLQGHLNKMNK